MAALSGPLRRGTRRRGGSRPGDAAEAGFTIVEAVVAAGILVIAVLLTVAPLVISMRALDRSKDVTVAEGLAQARMEQVRSLQFADIGHPDGAPSGILAREVTETVEGAQFTVATTVQFVGAATGLNIVPQGGDGVEGAYDIGINYKYVQVTVTPVDGSAAPVTMETFIAPPTVGGLESIALVEVEVDRHEPFDPGVDPVPKVRLTGPQIYTAFDAAATQIFPEIVSGTYSITLVTDDGWLLHPATVDSGADSVTATPGVAASRTIRVFQPVSLDVTVVDDTTSQPISDATVTITNLAYGPPVTNSPGDYSFTELVPDTYWVEVAAAGYSAAFAEVEVPGVGGGNAAAVEFRLTPQSFVSVDHEFYVDYTGWASYYVHGATVTVTHPTHGSFVGTTDETGRVTLSLPADETGFVATATTSWGHGPATANLSTGTVPGATALSLTKPTDTDRFALRRGGIGPSGFFEYKIGAGQWVQLPANDLGRATFVVAEDRGTVVELRTFCSAADHPGSPAATASTKLNDSDKSWNARVSC